MNDRVDDRIAHGTWTRDPVRSSLDHEGALVVESAEGSDWWRDTAYGFRHENGHALLGAVVTTGASDWSTGRVDEWVGSAATVRASRIADAVVIRARSSVDPE